MAMMMKKINSTNKTRKRLKMNTNESIGYQENLRGRILSSLIEKKEPVYIYLVNGVKLDGTILAFDECCCYVSENQMVFYSSISTIRPKSEKVSWQNLLKK
jgi:RNA chaperone Hfq